MISNFDSVFNKELLLLLLLIIGKYLTYTYILYSEKYKNASAYFCEHLPYLRLIRLHVVLVHLPRLLTVGLCNYTLALESSFG